MNKTKRNFIITAALFLLFAIFTVLVKTVDVAAIGPEGSSVGFSSINGYFFNTLGRSELFYEISDIFGKIAILSAVCFALLGAYQLIKRKSLVKVDKCILLLAAFYVAVAIAYVLFEVVVINYRPVILEEGLEVSYPSSHTMLATCFMSAAIIVLGRLFKDKKALKITSYAVCSVIIAVTVICRLASGVHWFTDILGGVLLSAALVMLYVSALSFFEKE
ncbi:MAG: phosphatase PAP2 family protein [Clostridia bacterium]|nr:phosphatase PAP2 family protein [Clostridia bacterium]